MIKIKEVLLRQKQEIEEKLKQHYINRQIKPISFDNQLINIIIGPRRCGKSFLGLHLVSSDKDRPFAFLNFDDEIAVDINEYDLLLAEMNSVYGTTSKILFDEIQNLSRWELLLNRLQREGVNLVITGSNAHLLGSELATHLTGRHTQIVLFTFSFAEYLEALKATENSKKSYIQSACNRYLTDGGYPEPLMTNVNRKDYLTTLFQATIYKDIVKKRRISASRIIEDLARYLISNTGTEYSYRTLVRVIECKSDRTARKYVSMLEEAFLLFSVPRFSFKVREQAAANKKIYCIDNGLITAIGFSLSPGIGRLAENAVAICLHKKELEGTIRLFFWKNQSHEEVDFVVVKDLSVHLLIQVCWNLDNPKTRNRETRALIKASKELQCNNLLILTEDNEGSEQITWSGLTETVRFLPLWKWLLDQGEVES